MSDKRIRYLANAAVRQRVLDEIRSAEDGSKVTIEPPARTLDQNAVQWPYLDAFSKQLKWSVNGEMVLMTAEEWKDVLTAAFKQDTARLAMGLDGGVVMLGQRTSKFPKKVFSEWIDFLKATAALRGVVVHEKEEANA